LYLWQRLTYVKIDEVINYLGASIEARKKRKNEFCRKEWEKISEAVEKNHII
jgi:hypothetical protein